MTLTDFLLARITEDEEVARYAEPGPWRLDDEHLPTQAIAADGDPVIRAATGRDWTFQTSFVAHHVVRWDPARVLAECQAKRRIVEQWQRMRAIETSGSDDDYRRQSLGMAAAGVREALKKMAKVYAQHPDYMAWEE